MVPTSLHPRHTPTLLTLLLAIVLVTTTSPSSAQSVKPVRYGAAARIEGKTLYVGGGRDGSDGIGQFISLDLTTPSWYTSNPPWTTLQPLPADLAKGPHQCSVVLSESGIFCSSHGIPFSVYSMASNAWSLPAGTVPQPYTGMAGVWAVTDPATGKVIVPTGYIPVVSGSPYETLTYDVNTNGLSTTAGMQSAGAGVPKDIREYAVVWSTERKSVLVYGGIGNNKLLEYVPSLQKWSVLVTTGFDPGARDSACFVPANQGKTLVLFGGIVGTEALGSIHFLDVATLTWSKGKDIALNLRRFGHVCATAGDSFMAWGGTDQNTTTAVNFAEPVVFNMKVGAWTNLFELVTSKKTDPSLPDPTDPHEHGANVGAIVGGTVGGLVLLGLGFFFYRRRKVAGNEAKGSTGANPDNVKDYDQIHMQNHATLGNHPPPPPPPQPFVTVAPQPLHSMPPPAGPIYGHGPVFFEAAPTNLAPAIPTRPGVGAPQQQEQQQHFVPVAPYTSPMAYQPQAPFLVPSYQSSPPASVSTLPPNPTPVPLRNPQSREPSEPQHYGTTAGTLTPESHFYNSPSNPQQYPHVTASQEYYSPPAAPNSAPGSSPSQGSTMSPYTQYQDYPQQYPLTTTTATAMLGKTQSFSPSATSDASVSEPEDKMQRIAREIQQEKEQMEQMELELRIRQSRKNIQRLEAEKHAELLQGQHRDSSQTGYHS